MKKTLSNMVWVWMRAAPERLFSLFGYDWTAKRTAAKNGTDFGEEPWNQVAEARVRLGDDSEDDVLFVWRTKAIENLAYSGWRVNGGFEGFKKVLYFEIATSLEVLEKVMRYPV